MEWVIIVIGSVSFGAWQESIAAGIFMATFLAGGWYGR